MKRPRMAFVMTASLLSLAACEKAPKGGGGECKPPDCHMNPPPPPPRPVADAAAGTSQGGCMPPDCHRNPPPPVLDAGKK